MSAGNSDPRRDAIHDFFQKQGPADDDIEGALLTGWAVVLEWVAPDDQRWISRLYAPTTSNWAAKGMWHEALFGEWPAATTEDDDDS